MGNLKRLRQCAEDDWLLDITDLAKEFFGDSIVKAEISWDNSLTDNEITIEHRIDDFLNQKRKNVKDGLGLSFDAGNMLLTLSNNKQVLIWNSEWGGIKSAE